MDDQELKRFKRIIVVSWFLGLLLLIGIAAYGSYHLTRLDNKIETKTYDLEKEIEILQQPNVETRVEKGLPGNDGKDGRDGIDGNNGTSGLNGSQGPVGPKGDTGAAGKDGATGPEGRPGRTIFTRLNPLNNEWECKYLGDLEWQPEDDCI